mmetsp:Transcript_16256/g.37344  ORF Transcript_16256/g.37344 Transcript_16256/m.37344 type:complete len:218 (+) Transcript_16256:71-724(+)
MTQRRFPSFLIIISFPSLLFWHFLLLLIVLYITFLIIMWCNFHQPGRFNRCHLSHIFLRCQCQFKVNDPWGWFLFLGQDTTWMDVHRLGLLCRLVFTGSSKFCHVIEKTRCNGFQNSLLQKKLIVGIIVAVVVVVIFHFDSFTKSLKLFTNISCLSHAPYLHKIFEAPLGTVICLGPFIVTTHQGDVITTTTTSKVESSCIGMQCLFLGSIEYRCTQ